MCGIAGIISLDNLEVKDGSARVKKMLKNMSYRGPDGEGIFVDKDKKIVLGNNRLAITDPNYRLNGPFYDANENIVMSFNGEIYDYIQQSSKLTRNGTYLKTNTDTEVLMKGIKKKGIDFLSQIDGCWAFAYFDINKKELIISRDLLGEKQIFFYKNKKEFIFSSEVFSLLSVVNDKLNINLIELITSIRFFASSQSNTLIDGIKKFKAGQTLIFDLSNKNRILECYPVTLKPTKWIDYFNSEPSDDSVINILSELLFTSVKNRLAREVPFFTTLSGGIDSNLMTYFASSEKSNIDSIFIDTSKNIMPSPDKLNEKEASKHTSKLLKTNHHEIYVNPKQTSEYLRQNAIRSTDGLIDWGTVSFELIGNAVKEQNYKAILVSEGADELCGYGLDQINYFAYNKLEPSYGFLKLVNSLNKFIFIRKVFRRIKFLSSKVIEPYCSLNPMIFRPHHEAMGHDYLAKFFRRNIINITNNKYGVINNDYSDIIDKLDCHCHI